MTPEIEKAARALLGFGLSKQQTIEATQVVLETLVEPSDGEVEAATVAYLKQRAYRERELGMRHSLEPVIYDDIRAALRAAALHRLGRAG